MYYHYYAFYMTDLENAMFDLPQLPCLYEYVSILINICIFMINE